MRLTLQVFCWFYQVVCVLSPLGFLKATCVMCFFPDHYRFSITVELQWLKHWWLDYHGYFELVLEYLGKILWLQNWDNLV